MKFKNILFVLPFLMLTHAVLSQTTQFRYRVLIQNKHEVIQDVKTQEADTVVLPAGSVVSYQRTYVKDKTKYTVDIKDTLKAGKTIYGTKAIPVQKDLPGWATVAIDEKDKSKLHINYWLGDQYDRDGAYYLKLKNRQYASFWFNSIEGGALTIPFKYRKSFTKNNIEVSDEFTADLNVGAYLGYSLGKIKYMYRKHEDTKPRKWLVSVGPFLSVSRVEVDSTNTTTALKPFDSKKAIATVSPGIGFMTSVYDFRFGVFLGKDIAIGSAAKQWDYHNRWWWGFGFGYNLGLIWGKPE